MDSITLAKRWQFDGVEEDGINFVHCDSNGQFVEVEFKKLFIDVEDGILVVLKVAVPHLSRFGFSR